MTKLPTEVFASIYPIFKREVYQRRHNMMALARHGSVTFYVLILLNLTALPQFSVNFTAKLAISSGAFLIAIVWIGQIHQERVRHREAKSQLIALERQAEFFTKGTHLPEESLYPATWDRARQHDVGLVMDLGGLILLAIVSILCAMMA
jgi:hypothetical protein